jgi:hypothetical protein
LSLSIFITSSTLMVSLLAISISALILAITAVPVFLMGCKIAENVYTQSTIPHGVIAVCGMKVRAPKIVHSRSVEFRQSREWPHVAPTSAPGKY